MSTSTAKGNHQASILVVDDETDAVYSFRRLFEKADYIILEAHSGSQALSIAKQDKPDVILMDVRMPGASGLETLKEIHRLDPRVPVILMTAYASTQGTIEAMKAGAFDYVLKPFDIEKIRAVVRSAVKMSLDMRQPVGLGQQSRDAHPQDDQIIGRSEAMQEVYKSIGRVAVSDLPVLISGEAGSGKELVARAIYQHSQRASQPFLTLKCSSVSPDQMDYELFGLRRGAIFGAPGDKLGKLEMANNGTLLLDGVEFLSLHVQAKLVKFLEVGELDRTGDPRPVKVDARVMATTEEDLATHVEAGMFRADLYQRLALNQLPVPPLRTRQGDLPLLVDYFLGKHASSFGLQDVKLDDGAIEALRRHTFPGNVRELEVILRSALVRTKGNLIREDDLELTAFPAGAVASGPPPLAEEKVFDMLFDEIARRQPLPDGFDAFDVVERKLIIRALESCNGNQSKASRFLGITRNTLRKRILKYGLSKEREDQDEAGADELSAQDDE